MSTVIKDASIPAQINTQSKNIKTLKGEGCSCNLCRCFVAQVGFLDKKGKKVLVSKCQNINNCIIQ